MSLLAHRYSSQTTPPLHLLTAGYGRYCCKSLFALLIKNSPGCRRDFRVKMWGTSSPDDKLTGDPRWRDEGTQIGGRASGRLVGGEILSNEFFFFFSKNITKTTKYNWQEAFYFFLSPPAG